MINCPVCNSEDHVRLFPEFIGKGISSDWYLHSKVEIYNACCKNCGLVYEGKGIRDFSYEFYDKVFKPKPMMKVYGKKEGVSRQKIAYDLLKNSLDLESDGRLLEAGAGMGGFSKIFSTENLGWEIKAFEPSASFEKLKTNTEQHSNTSITRTGYEGFSSSIKFNLIVSLGVLEHVSNPLDMLKWAKNLLDEKGTLFLEIPNFKYQPNDLLCIDHLSKLTLEMIQNLASSVGLEVYNYEEKGVPLYLWLRHSSNNNGLKNLFDHSFKIAKENEEFITNTFDAINTGIKNAKDKGENFAVFGLATIGLMAPIYLKLDDTDIICYIDENEGLWQSEIFGKKVYGLDAIDKFKIRHLALTISPKYIDQVKRKLGNFDVRIYHG